MVPLFFPASINKLKFQFVVAPDRRGREDSPPRKRAKTDELYALHLLFSTLFLYPYVVSFSHTHLGISPVAAGVSRQSEALFISVGGSFRKISSLSKTSLDL
jgi:hypothetical protein